MPVSLGDGLRRVAAFFLNLEEECGSNYNGLAVSEGFQSASRTQALPPALRTGAPCDQNQAEIEARVMGSPEGSSQTSRTPSFSDSWTPPRPAASEWTASTRLRGEAPHRPVGSQANHRIKSGGSRVSKEHFTRKQPSSFFSRGDFRVARSAQRACREIGRPGHEGQFPISNLTASIT